MKISIVASSIFPGHSLGVEYFAYGMINALGLKYPEHSLDILIPVTSSEEWQNRIKPGLKVNFHEVFLSPGLFPEAKVKSKGKFSLRGLAKKNRFARSFYTSLQEVEETKLLHRLSPDIIYYPFHRHPVRDVGAPMVITVHDLRSFTPEFFDQQSINIVNKNLHLAQGLISSWKHPYNHLHQLFPEHARKLHLIPFPPPIMAGPQATPFIADQEETLLLYPSWVTPHKNHQKLLEAMPEVIAHERIRRRRKVKLLCVGSYEKDTFEVLNRTIQNLSLQENVEFTGYVNEKVLQDYYSRATMIVCPTLWEAAAGSIFEAFTFGKPVACSDIAPLLSQIEQANAHASFFDPHNPIDIARGILEVLENQLPYVDGSKRGAQFIRSLTWEASVQEYMMIFEKLQSGNRLS